LPRGVAMLDEVGKAPAPSEEFKALRDKANVALGFAALTDEKPSVRSKAAASLAKIGGASIPPLVQALRDKDPTVALYAAAGLIRAGDQFRRLIDLALKYGGSYLPAYHRHALRRQVDACYPQLQEFLKLKLKHDPQELFQSEWYRHYKRMFEKP